MHVSGHDGAPLLGLSVVPDGRAGALSYAAPAMKLDTR
jgi:hypothetical protein